MRRTSVQIAAAVFIVMSLVLVTTHAQTPSPAASGDCCSDQAQQKIANSLGFVDIVGIKLGMSPQQAIAALKAHDPNLKIETLTARLEDPSGPLGNSVKVPYSVNAHTLNHNTTQGPTEWIALQFTTPPNHAVVAKIVRYTRFTAGQPVPAATLLAALRMKYGQENLVDSGYRVWVYDSNGKLLTRTLSSLESGGCIGDSEASSVPGGALADHPSGETGINITLASTSATQAGPEKASICAPLVFVAASNVGSDFAPNSQQIQMTVTLQSGALIYGSTKSTHDWLQARSDAKAKQLNDAAKQRAAPKL